MGRIKEKKELKDRRGPGRKARKQTAPKIVSREDGLGVKKEGHVGGRIKQRARKRALMAAAKAAYEEKIRKKKEKQKKVLAEYNKSWLKPIAPTPESASKNSHHVSFSQDLLSDGNSSEDDEGIYTNAHFRF